MRTKKSKAKHGFDLEHGKESLVNAKDAITNAAYDMKDKFIDAKDKLVDVEKNVVSYTKSNPLKAMGLSVVAGMVIAQLLRLRK